MAAENYVGVLGEMLLQAGVSEASMIFGCGMLSEIFNPGTLETIVVTIHAYRGHNILANAPHR